MKRPLRQRDGQQWLQDYLIKTTGRAVHHEGEIPPDHARKAFVKKSGEGMY